MNSPLDLFFRQGLLLDLFGVCGLGLIALAAIRLSRRHGSWGGTMMAFGALALMFARLYFILAPHVITDDLLHAIGPVGISLTFALPPLLLTLGLAGVVWGLWGHDRWLKQAAR
ncbi:MAG TPA: hypothetical protein VLO11_06325 [Luteolibacter sp.]|nr:hypothetical protein [Luteolibacter sp.]